MDPLVKTIAYISLLVVLSGMVILDQHLKGRKWDQWEVKPFGYFFVGLITGAFIQSF